MQLLKKSLQIFNLNILICSLYTLSGNHKVFKKFNIPNDIYLDKKNIKYFSNQVTNFNDFEELLKRSWLKQFALYLLAPFFNSQVGLDSKTEIVNKKICKETTLLKKYLRKFKRNYHYYFFYQNGNYENFPTNKEINTYAIKYLFFIAGI